VLISYNGDMDALRSLGWFLSIVYSTIPLYWIIVHPRARSWGSARKAPLTLLGGIWFGLWIAAGVMTWPWRDVVMYDTPWSWLVAAPFFALGLYVYAKARRDFSLDQLVGRSELQPEKHEQRLVTTGIRKRVRHPLYLGHLLELVAWTIGTGSIVCVGLLVFALTTGAMMLEEEDAELESRFGDAYRDYRARVPAIIPRLRD